MWKSCGVILFASVVISIALYKATFGCRITDDKALIEVKNFLPKVGIQNTQVPWILDTSFTRPILNSRVKEVALGARGDFKRNLEVSCNNGEVVSFFNWVARDNLIKKYNISTNTNIPPKWPKFLNENDARIAILRYANMIGLPADVAYVDCRLEKHDGYWRGSWKRMLNGYAYEEDAVDIQILAVSGELFSYYKRYDGKPCPTEVHVTKEQAIEEGWLQIQRLFGKVDWNKYKQDYEIKSAELKIVQPNTLLGRMFLWHSTESRLAWVIEYRLKVEPDMQKLIDVKYLTQITIKIDAATKKFLGGDHP